MHHVTGYGLSSKGSSKLKTCKPFGNRALVWGKARTWKPKTVLRHEGNIEMIPATTLREQFVHDNLRAQESWQVPIFPLQSTLRCVKYPFPLPSTSSLRVYQTPLRFLDPARTWTECTLGHSSQSHAHVWDRCSHRQLFREREDRIKMTEQDQAEAWNEHTSKQTQGVCPVSTSMLGHRPERETTHQQPRRLLQYTGAIQVQWHFAAKGKRGKSTYVHPGEPRAQDLSHMLGPQSTLGHSLSDHLLEKLLQEEGMEAQLHACVRACVRARAWVCVCVRASRRCDSWVHCAHGMSVLKSCCLHPYRINLASW